MRMTRAKRMLLGALVALIVAAGGLGLSNAHPADARVCLTNRCSDRSEPILP
jgi:hypothetical protein